MHPDMTISIREPHRQFFDGMLAVATASGKYETSKHLDFDKLLGMDIANFTPADQMGQRDMFGQLIHTKDAGKRIRVDVRAVRWDPDPPTYELFARAAKHIFCGLLSAYNREHGTRYRLTIPKKEFMLPRLPPRAREAFERFAALANMRWLHPLDWERFYQFVRVCHATRVHLYEDEIRYHLVQAGFDPEKANVITQIHYHLQDFMNTAERS